MLIDEIIKYCDSNYSQCSQNCGRQENCSCNCRYCLDIIFRGNPPSRAYDCYRMVNFYVCKYAYKYATEMIYALNDLDLDFNFNPKILSVGCGPGTELLALDYLHTHSSFDFEFIGLDINDIWEKVHNEIQSQYSVITSSSVKFEYDGNNTNEYIENWANIVIFQYVFSDISHFSDFDTYIASILPSLNKLPSGSYIIINDINSNTKDLMIEFSNKLQSFDVKKFYFPFPRYSRFGNAYGDGSSTISLKFTIPFRIKLKYDSLETCTSVQMILRKR